MTVNRDDDDAEGFSQQSREDTLEQILSSFHVFENRSGEKGIKRVKDRESPP